MGMFHTYASNQESPIASTTTDRLRFQPRGIIDSFIIQQTPKGVQTFLELK